MGFWLWLGLSGYYLRCVGVFGWFMKRDLVERSMIHECSNHVHRGKTQHETCFTLAVHDSRTARKPKTLSTMGASIVSVPRSQPSHPLKTEETV